MAINGEVFLLNLTSVDGDELTGSFRIVRLPFDWTRETRKMFVYFSENLSKSGSLLLNKLNNE